MFKPSSFFASLVAVLATLVAFQPNASAQVCPDPANLHYQNDIFPMDPSGQALPIALVLGVCEGEAAGSVFTITGSTPQKLTQVACPFTSASGVGIDAVVNLVVYDNVTFNGAGVPQMGNVVFDLAAATGSEMQIGHGLNTLDVSSYNILVNGPKFVVAFFMSFNPNGGCAFPGHTSNFYTDNTPCVNQKNLIFIQGQGWVDTKLAKVSGFSLCNLGFYTGNWVIRCCTEPFTNPFYVTAVGTPALPGQFINLVFNAPGYAGKLCVAAASGSTSPGIPLPPHGTFPLAYDPLLEYVVFGGGGGVFFNFVNTVGPLGTSPGLILLPPNAPSGIQFYVAFVAFDPLDAGVPWAISSPTLIQIL